MRVNLINILCDTFCYSLHEFYKYRLLLRHSSIYSYFHSFHYFYLDSQCQLLNYLIFNYNSLEVFLSICYYVLLLYTFFTLQVVSLPVLYFLWFVFKTSTSCTDLTLSNIPNLLSELLRLLSRSSFCPVTF